jgi:hypothetical protein
MAEPSHPETTFSPYRRWGIGLNVSLVILTVFAVVVMVNYLSHDYFARYYLSSRGRIPLSPLTTKFLESLTNQVKITIYYDKSDSYYSMIVDLLTEYKTINPRLQVQTVDYLRDPGSAMLLKEKYRKYLGAPGAKDLIIFDCEGRSDAVNGKALIDYVTERVPDEKKLNFLRKPFAFTGERLFTLALIEVTTPKRLKAYFLQCDGGHDIDDTDENVGYSKFAGILRQNYVEALKLSLLGTNQVPEDCNVLVIPGPSKPIPEVTLEKVNQYLDQGGRLLVLFNFASRETGLEPMLARWGVSVGTNVIKDLENTEVPATGNDMVVRNFSRHPIVNSVRALHLILPHSVGKLRNSNVTADAARVDEIAMTGPSGFAPDNKALGHRSFPLMVAVEKGAIKGVTTDRGTTRMVVLGDSIFLGNHQIDSADNQDFGGYVVNWLLDRPQLLEGIHDRKIAEYRLVMTHTQLKSAEWILLAGFPGAVLGFGLLIWLRRRQ